MARSLQSLHSLCQSVAASFNKEICGGDIFVKILTSNDDAGRHGVLVPTEVYGFFPEMKIEDPRVNVTVKIEGFDCHSGKSKTLSYKYYQRYPERRITCLNSNFDDRNSGMRMAIFVRAVHEDGTTGCYVDLARQQVDADFDALWRMIFGEEVELKEGAFVLREVGAPLFRKDESLEELLILFDKVYHMGYVKARRTGDTGIGYTFEDLIGIKENNDKTADFKGIEIKCKRSRSNGSGGKINLFQQGPVWSQRLTLLDRIQQIGKLSADGRYACHSQVTTKKNNLDLWLDTSPIVRIDLLKGMDPVGYWEHNALEKRLMEKHARAAFIKADVRGSKAGQTFQYKELIYCERPSIQRFRDLVDARRIVFEFLMSEKAGKIKTVRNHGYPWRLVSVDDLANLFSVRVKLR